MRTPNQIKAHLAAVLKERRRHQARGRYPAVRECTMHLDQLLDELLEAQPDVLPRH